MPIVVPLENPGKRHYNQVIWSESEDQQLVQNFSKLRASELEQLFSLSYEQIRTRARTLGLKSRKTSIREQFNKDFFEKITIENSYWAGFLQADGCISKNKKRLWIGLSDKDSEHLVKFATALCLPNDRIRTYLSVAGGIAKGKEYTRSVFEVQSQKLIEDLKNNFNVLPQKTLQPNLPPEKVEGDFKLAFLAGAIDGDGFIGTYNQDKYIRFGLIGSEAFCNWARETVNNTLISLHRIPTSKVSQYRPPQWEIRCVGRNAQIFLNQLEQICGDLLLERKWRTLRTFNATKKWIHDKTIKDSV